MFEDVYITAPRVQAPGAPSASGLRSLLFGQSTGLTPRDAAQTNSGYIGTLSPLSQGPGTSRALALARSLAGALRGDLRGLDLCNTPLIIGTVQGAYPGALHRSAQGPSTPPPGTLALTIAEALGLGGPTQTLGMACVSSAAAILLAAQHVSSGRCDAVIAGGIEAPSPMVHAGFQGLGALGEGPPRPFDNRRNGMTLSEGGGLVVVEGLESARRGGRTPMLRLLGGGEASDAHRLARPHPEGRGGNLAARRALRHADITPDDITLIQGHGTGTRPGDLAEAKGFAGAGLKAPIQGLKGYFGHALGATGVIEIIAMALQFEAGSFAPTLGYGEPDPDIPLPILGTQAPASGPALLSWYAFGGNQITLVVTAPGEVG